MTQFLVRNLEDDVKARLRLRARRDGRSTEEEVREIPSKAVMDEAGVRELLGSGRASLVSGSRTSLRSCAASPPGAATFEG